MASTEQQRCFLLDLPAEVRVHIFEHVFRGTRLTFGDVDLDSDLNDMHSIPRITRPRAHSLALLYTCRQVHSDCRDSWMSFILFNFDSPNAMLAALLPRGETFISKVRYLRILNSQLWLRHPGAHGPWSYDVVWFMKLLPGLQLDTLYILVAPWKGYDRKDHEDRWYRPMDNSRSSLYVLIGDLIRFGTGWRNLELRLPNSAILTVDNEMYSSVQGEDAVRSDVAKRWAGSPKWHETRVESSPLPIEDVKASIHEQQPGEISEWDVLDELGIDTDVGVVTPGAFTIDPNTGERVPYSPSGSFHIDEEDRNMSDAEIDNKAWNDGHVILKRDYDRTSFGIGSVIRGQSRTIDILRHPLIIRLSRAAADTIAHEKAYPVMGDDPVAWKTHPDDDVANPGYPGHDPRSWLEDLDWQSIKSRYIDGTELEYGGYRKQDTDDDSDNELAWVSRYEYGCEPTKVLCRRIFDETRRQNRTVCYDAYDDVHDCDGEWINYLDSAIDQEKMQLKESYVFGDESYLLDKEWLKSIGAVHHKLY